MGAFGLPITGYAFIFAAASVGMFVLCPAPAPYYSEYEMDFSASLVQVCASRLY